MKVTYRLTLDVDPTAHGYLLGEIPPGDPREEELLGLIRDAALAGAAKMTELFDPRLGVRLESVLLDAVDWGPRTADAVEVPAFLKADSGAVKARFDAAPWLRQASANEITDLDREGWAHGYVADGVADFFRLRNPQVRAVFDYLDSIADVPEMKDFSGFSCRIDARAGRKWLQIHRPDVLAKMLE